MYRTPVLLAVTAAIAALTTATAAATPPLAAITRFDSIARSQLADRGVLDFRPGSGVVAARYTLAPGVDSGWHRLSGPMLMSVSAGTLSIQNAAGCTVRRYQAGHSGLLPAGDYLIRNDEATPLDVVGAFLNAQAAPFAATAPVLPPPRCAAGPDHQHQTRDGAPVIVELGHGEVVDHAAYGHSDHLMTRGNQKLPAEPGKDLYMVAIGALPGSSGGWVQHQSAFVIVTKGAITYYEGHDGQCTQAGSFHAGQVYVHPHRHTHLATTVGPDAFEGIFVFLNLPHNPNPVPVVGSYLEAGDQTVLPSPGCPRL